MRTKSFLLAALLMAGVTMSAFAQQGAKEKECDTKRPQAPRREAPAPMGIDCTLATTMKLTIEQVYAIGQAQIEAREAMKELRENKEMSREDAREKMMELKKKQKETIKNTLTDEQYIIYLEHQLKAKPRGERGEGAPRGGEKRGERKGEKGERPERGERPDKDAPKAEKK